MERVKKKEGQKVANETRLMNIASAIGNQTTCQMMPVVQNQSIKITDSELTGLESAHYDDVVHKSYEELIEHLQRDGHLDPNAIYMVIDPGEKDETTYGVHEGQYLSPQELRASLGAGTAGGEAHHIIPSCIAAVHKYPKDLYNKDWNGIMLPGSKKETTGKIIRPLTIASALPYHRRNDTFDHPTYTKMVRKEIDKGVNPATLAATLKTKINTMGAGKYIDDINI